MTQQGLGLPLLHWALRRFRQVQPVRPRRLGLGLGLRLRFLRRPDVLPGKFRRPSLPRTRLKLERRKKVRLNLRDAAS